ncbi:MAG: Fimbrial assembly family protein [Pedosphaera sp.]|nr:Fimbrial assembly family protein [Pedosphaera sp.]
MKKTRWQSCNVLQLGADSRQLWEFAASKTGFTLDREQSLPVSGPLPLKAVAKDWKVLFQPKLNVALLPIDKAFLRVAHLPVSTFEETLAMVELQMEKLSPLPVTQVVWNIQVLPHHVDNLQTVIVIIAARDLVEELLGQLEGQGYQADRLEIPFIDQLQATPITGDGAWIYPGSDTGKFTAVVAWWYGGVLRNLGLLHVAAVQNRGELLEEQLKQMTWAGEMEGWLTSPPRWHLVADEATARLWQPMFFSWLGQAVEVEAPLTAVDLATLTANRSARADLKAGILPTEYFDRYHQQFVNRLWIRGLGAVLSVYVFGVLVYFSMLSVQTYQTQKVDTEMRGMSLNYTNTLKLKAQRNILQERAALKFASLDCWKKTAELLPESLTIAQFDFRNGKTLSLHGTAPADGSKLILDFNEALRKATTEDGQPMFEQIESPLSSLGPGGGSWTWSFSGELKRGVAQ